jgi:hypothetical protein
VRNGNYVTWPKLMVELIHRHMPDSEETIKGHLKGKRQGIRSMNQQALDKMVEDKKTHTESEDETSPFKPTRTTKLFFVQI